MHVRRIPQNEIFAFEQDFYVFLFADNLMLNCFIALWDA